MMSDQNILRSRMSPDSCLALFSQDYPTPLTSNFLEERSKSLGIAWKESVSIVNFLDLPGCGRGYYLLPSPGALSSPPGNRKPGSSRLEGWLKRRKVLLRGEVLNPQLLERGFGLPLDWTDPLELRQATRLLESEEPL